MHLISFDASARQLGKLRKGLPTRIKRGTGFNLVVNPNNYHLVSRAFTKNKGVDLKLSPEELEFNSEMSPEEHEQLSENIDENLFQYIPFSEGGSIFKKIKKALNSKTAKKIGRELKPVSRILKQVGREIAHEKLADMHMDAVDRYGDNAHQATALNALANYGHHKIGGRLRVNASKAGDLIKNTARRLVGAVRPIGSEMGQVVKTGGKLGLSKKFKKRLAKDLSPLGNELGNIGREMAHEKIAETHMNMADRYGDDERSARALNALASYGHNKVGSGLYAGAGLYAGRGMNVHDALKLANLATAQANHQLAKIHNHAVHGMITQPPIRGYYNGNLDPPSRGSGINRHHNLIRGRGSLLSQDNILPPALQSQPYGANFHMQFFLPPEYKKYNDGGEVEGRGMYL